MSTPSIPPDPPNQAPEAGDSRPSEPAVLDPSPADVPAGRPDMTVTAEAEEIDRLERYLKGPTAFCA